jgi:hypothetical protein
MRGTQSSPQITDGRGSAGCWNNLTFCIWDTAWQFCSIRSSWPIQTKSKSYRVRGHRAGFNPPSSRFGSLFAAKKRLRYLQLPATEPVTVCRPGFRTPLINENNGATRRRTPNESLRRRRIMISRRSKCSLRMLAEMASSQMIRPNSLSERALKMKRPFTLPELRTVLHLARDGWRSMVLFGLCSGQRLGDIATLKWNNIDLVHGETAPFNSENG